MRITEVLADPAAPGNDASFEWVELTNYGDETVWLIGVALEDASGRTDVEAHLEPRGVLVVAAAEAEVGDAAHVLRVERIGNGLRNDGDVLPLVGAGETIDEASCGDSVGAEQRPGAGQSLERWFDRSGAFLGARVANTPTPGHRTEPPPVSTPDANAAPDADRTAAPVAPSTAEAASTATPPSPSASTVGASDTNVAVYLVLFTIAGIALGGVGVYRAMEVLQDRRRD